MNRSGQAVVLVLAVASMLILAASPASATPQEERQGSRLLQELEAGQLKCSDAGAADFELVGEYAMGRTFGSPIQHEAMNQMMSRMMGGRGEETVHGAMGGASPAAAAANCPRASVR